MPRYARAVIPGRPQDGRDLDRLVFGEHDEGYDQLATEPEAYEEEDEEEDFVERAPANRRRSKGRRRDDYAPLPDDHGGYEKEPSNGRGLMLLVGTLVICGAFGAVVWNAYSGGIRTAEASTAPLLQASGPIKTRPLRDDEPVESALRAGVFDRMEETPVVREAEREPAPEVVEMAAAEPIIERPVAQPAARPEPTPKPEPEPVEVAKAEPAVATPVVTREPVNAPTPLKAPPRPDPEPEAPAQLVGAFAPKFVPGAAHVVQIGATDSLAKADAEYARVAGLAPDLFAGAERVVVPVQVNGTQMYRVRVGSFASADDANAFCSAYKARVGDCYRATR